MENNFFASKIKKIRKCYAMARTKAEVISLIIFSIVLSCNFQLKDQRGGRDFSMNERNTPDYFLEELVLEKGDTNAYEDLRISYLDYEHGKFLKFAKVMADKYKYCQAYYDVYCQIEKPTLRKGFTLSLDSCTEKEKNEAIKYLYLAKRAGHHQAENTIEELKKMGFMKSLIK